MTNFFIRNSCGLYKLRPKTVISNSTLRLSTTKKGSVTSSSNDGISDKPIEFFGSKAASWKAKQTRSGGADDILWYQPYVLSASLGIFLLYFCYLREENDIDRKLEGKLFDKVEGMEEVTLILNYKYNKEHGLDSSEIEKRLKELGKDIRAL